MQPRFVLDESRVELAEEFSAGVHRCVVGVGFARVEAAEDEGGEYAALEPGTSVANRALLASVRGADEGGVAA